MKIDRSSTDGFFAGGLITYCGTQCSAPTPPRIRRARTDRDLFPGSGPAALVCSVVALLLRVLYLWLADRSGTTAYSDAVDYD
jgi:hypothetical protein